MEQPNYDYIDDLAGDDLEFKNKMISIIKAELPVEIDQYKNSIAERDFKKSAEFVHKIKHKITILGLEKTYEIAEKYEEDLKKGRADFHVKFMEILDAMIKFLDEI